MPAHTDTLWVTAAQSRNAARRCWGGEEENDCAQDTFFFSLSLSKFNFSPSDIFVSFLSAWSVFALLLAAGMSHQKKKRKKKTLFGWTGTVYRCFSSQWCKITLKGPCLTPSVLKRKERTHPRLLPELSLPAAPAHAVGSRPGLAATSNGTEQRQGFIH